MSRALPDYGDLVIITGGYTLNGPLDPALKGALGRIERAEIKTRWFDNLERSGPLPACEVPDECRERTGPPPPTSPGVRVIRCSDPKWVWELLMADLLQFRVLSGLELLALSLEEDPLLASIIDDAGK